MEGNQSEAAREAAIQRAAAIQKEREAAIQRALERPKREAAIQRAEHQRLVRERAEDLMRRHAELRARRIQIQADYEEALKLGEVLAAYARVMLIGAAGVGKSSLLSGLMNLPLPLAESTKLAEALMVKYQWAKAGDPDDSYWSKLEEEDELMEVAKLVRIAAESKSARGSKKASVLASLLEADAAKDSTDVPVTTKQQSDDKFQQEATKVQENVRSKILSKALLKDAATAQASPQKEAMIHVWDCGGQPVFLDVLPAFLTGRTMFFLMFDAKKGLGSQYEALCHHKGEIVPGSRKTQNITILELLQRWMASIHAMLCKAPSNAAIPEYPRIIPIGTHGDDPDVQEKKTEILQTLHTHCEGKAFAPLLIDSTIVDNTTAGQGREEDKAYKYLRQQVHKFTMENVAVHTPVAWFHFQKVFQEVAKENPIVPFEQAVAVAKVCGNPVGTVPSILNFFHELAVFLYYSSVESLRRYVVADPRWLVQQFAKLLALEGQEIVPRQQFWKLLREKGILVQPLYEEVWKGLQLPAQALVDLLEHFLLAVLINTRSQFHQIGGREYFIPSMLDSKPESEAHQLISKKQASPLHLTFSTQYIPPGFFARLVTALIKEPTCHLVFERGVFSNQVTFAYGEVGKIDEVTITEHTSSIQINVIRLAHRLEPHHIPMFQASCRSILKLILTCSEVVCEWFPSIKVATALQCEECNKDHHLLPIPSNATVHSHLRCERNEVCHASPSQQYWLDIPILHKGDGSVSEVELRGISEEVKEAGKLESLAEALEVVPFLESVGGDPVRLMRRWCGSMGAQARSHLVCHLRSIGLPATADRLAYCEFPGDEQSLPDKNTSPEAKRRGVQALAGPSEFHDRGASNSAQRGRLGDQPTLRQLLKFPGRERVINIPEKISTKYIEFAAFLLQDDDGSKVRNITHKHREDSVSINKEIFLEWLQGKGLQPVTWETLIEVLRDIDLTTLAGDIESVLL